MNTNTHTNTNAVVFTGPFSKTTKKGTEICFWNVCITQGRTGEPMTYEVHSFEKAFKLTRNISHDRNLVIFNEAKEV
jgi:hypothetical protein